MKINGEELGMGRWGLSPFGLCTGGNSNTIWEDLRACLGAFSWHTSEVGGPVRCLCSWAWGCCHTTPNMHGLAGTCQVHAFEFRAAQHSWARAWGGSHPLLYRSYNLILEQPGPAEVRVFWPLVDLTQLSCPQSDVLVHTEGHCEKQPPKCVFVWSSLLWRVLYSAFSPQGPMR